MMREKKPCSGCGAKKNPSTRPCLDCQSSLCDRCRASHECGVDTRPPLVILLEGHVQCDTNPKGMIVCRINSICTVGYLPSRPTVSVTGLRILLSSIDISADDVRVRQFVDAMRAAPICARGAIAVLRSCGGVTYAHSGELSDDADARREFLELAKLLGQ